MKQDNRRRSAQEIAAPVDVKGGEHAPEERGMSGRNLPREPSQWEDERERADQGLARERRFSHHGGDPRWGTGGLRVDRRTARPDAALPGGAETRGPYAGRGPRGYHRTDERIHEEVCERLTEHGEVDASDIQVSVTSGEVMLRGTVATRAQKHLAEDIADATSGVVEVHNRLRVQRPGSEPPRGVSDSGSWPHGGSPSPDR